MFGDVMKELAALISESDLHLSQLTLHLLTSVSQVSKQSMSSVHEGILPQLFVLIRSPLLQGMGSGRVLSQWGGCYFGGVILGVLL